MVTNCTVFPQGTTIALRVTAMDKLCLPINAMETGWMLVGVVGCHQAPIVQSSVQTGEHSFLAGIVN